MVNGPDPGVADTYTRVTIDCFAGRSLDAKRTLYREIVTRLEALGIPRHDVSILLRESGPGELGLQRRHRRQRPGPRIRDPRRGTPCGPQVRRVSGPS